ncbi:reductase [Sarcoptes scabiei]|nr:reductase [Sarcoptes scabiei]
MTEKKFYHNVSRSANSRGDVSSSSYDRYHPSSKSREGFTRFNGSSNHSNGYEQARPSHRNNGFSSRPPLNGYRPRPTAGPPPPPPPGLPVIKSFYKESPATANRSQYEINAWLSENNVTFRGSRILNPILQFKELVGLPDGLMQSILKQGYATPTVIQSQAWPFALSGRDVVGIAQTGSGKTLGYSLPALVHVEGNSVRRKHGPSVLVLAPTRELAQQIKDVVNMFRVRAVCIFGGASKVGQRREYERTQPSIVIACPGRLIDFVEEGTVFLQNITYLVLDEADRMLDMGFEPQIRKIINQIPKNRQTLMWSATWPKEVRKLAEDFLVDYIQINIGSISLSANHNITQIVDVCEEIDKIPKLYKLLTEINANDRDNKTIIFAETKRKVDQLSQQMRSNGWHANAIHGDKPQTERDWALNEFRNGHNPILIATDVAARGLDVDDIKYVVNFDYPNCSEDYVHRIGRTGRRDRKGTSYTFFTINNAKQAGDLIDVMKEAKQEVPAKLYEYASQSHRFGKTVRRRYGNPYGNSGSYGGSARFGGYGEKRFGGTNSSGSSYGMKRKFDDYSNQNSHQANAYNGGGNRFKKPNYGANTHSMGSSNNAHQDRYNSY